MCREPRSSSFTDGPLEGLLEGSVLPGPNSVELLRTAPADYRLRFDGGNFHVAELFQENTKLSPHSSFNDPGAAVALKRAREWYMSTAYHVEEDGLVGGEADAIRLSVDALAPSLASILQPFTAEGPFATLLYGLDLFVLHEQWLLRVVPRTEFLWRERRLGIDDESRVRGTIVGAEPLPSKGPMLFLAAAPWRYMMFLGPRGYRRMLLDAGETLGRLRDRAAGVDVAVAVFLDFYERLVDDILLFDGVERTVVAIVALEGGQP